MDDLTAGRLYGLLYQGLVEIRHHARHGETIPVEVMADLLHNLPLALDRCRRGQDRYDEVLAALREGARARHCEDWLEDRLRGLD